MNIKHLFLFLIMVCFFCYESNAMYRDRGRGGRGRGGTNRAFSNGGEQKKTSNTQPDVPLNTLFAKRVVIKEFVFNISSDYASRASLYKKDGKFIINVDGIELSIQYIQFSKKDDDSAIFNAYVETDNPQEYKKLNFTIELPLTGHPTITLANIGSEFKHVGYENMRSPNSNYDPKAYKKKQEDEYAQNEKYLNEWLQYQTDNKLIQPSITKPSPLPTDNVPSNNQDFFSTIITSFSKNYHMYIGGSIVIIAGVIALWKFSVKNKQKINVQENSDAQQNINDQNNVSSDEDQKTNSQETD